ncbi:MAG: MCE family protein, partial [Polyangiales bacterium]
DPPRLDLALSLGYELLDNFVEIMRDHRDDIEDLITGAASTVKALDELLDEHDDRVGRILVNIETATEEASELMKSARSTVDSPEVQRIVRNLDRSLSAVSKDIDPLLGDLRSTTKQANETLATIGPEERKQIKKTLQNASELAERANRTVGDAQEIVSHVREGRGTVGAVVMDEELYDDIQEILRDLKHNPWKLFWKE